MPASIRSSGTITTQNTAQTIATVVAGDTLVYLGAVSDGDPVHRGIDSAPTLGGIALAAAPGLITSGGQNNQVDVYVLGNVAGGTNVSFQTAYHASTPGYLGAWFLIQAAQSTQPATSGSDAQNGGAAPSVALSGLTTDDLILEILASSGSAGVNSGQTLDFSGSGNGSNFYAAHRTAAAGTNTEAWSQAAAAAYAYAAVAIKGVASGSGPSPGQFFSFF